MSDGEWITEQTYIEVTEFGNPEVRLIKGPMTRRWVDYPPPHNCRTCGAPNQRGACRYCSPSVT